jgi:hypothetical protein
MIVNKFVATVCWLDGNHLVFLSRFKPMVFACRTYYNFLLVECESLVFCGWTSELLLAGFELWFLLSGCEPLVFVVWI